MKDDIYKCNYINTYIHIYMLILAIYVNYIFQDFESFLRTEVDLVEDDIRLVLDEYISNFISYE